MQYNYEAMSLQSEKLYFKQKNSKFENAFEKPHAIAHTKIDQVISKWNYMKLFSFCSTNFAPTSLHYSGGRFKCHSVNLFECGRSVCNEHIIIVMYLPICYNALIIPFDCSKYSLSLDYYCTNHFIILLLPVACGLASSQPI